jgi:pilus assembly protein FimV
MAELDEQLQSMQRLIMLKDEELLALQNKVAQKPEQQAAAPEVPAKPKPAAKPKATEPETTGVTDELLSDPVLVGLAGLLVVAVVGWLVVRRRRMQGGFEESILNVGLGGGAVAPAAGIAGGPESAMVSDFVMSDMTGSQGEGSDVDAISEADVYLAYGRHQQAEDILRQALDKTPDKLDLHSKLLEVFHAAKNSDAFEEQARILHEKIGGNESNAYWKDIVPLGREICPRSSLFGGTAGSAMDESIGEVTADEEDLLDFDFNPDEVEAAGALQANAGGNDLDEPLDFDMSALDFDMADDDSSKKTAAPKLSQSRAASAPKIQKSAPKIQNDDGGLDFDLSFGDDDSSSAIGKKPLSMELETTTDYETSHNSIDFGGLELESSESDIAIAEHDDSPIELSLEMEEHAPAASRGAMSLDFEHSADIVHLDTGNDEIDLDGELDEDIFSNVDEVGTKLDLAKAYVDMGDSDGARSILDEVLEEGDDSQKQQAEELLAQMG